MPCNALVWILYSILPAMRNPYIFFGNCFGWVLSMFYLLVVVSALPASAGSKHPLHHHGNQPTTAV